MNPIRTVRRLTCILAGLAAASALAAAAPAAAASNATAAATGKAAVALPPGNTVAQWNKIAEDTVVGSGAFQAEGLIYMAYVSAAVYDAVAVTEGGFAPYGPAITAPAGASADAAAVEAAYRTLVTYFPAQAGNLTALYASALGLIPGGTAKQDGQAVGLAAATGIIGLRAGDGRMTPIGVTSPFPALPPGPGVWRLTPPFAPAQTPWVATVRPFILHRLDRFLPAPPPSLHSHEWAEAFNQIKAYGAADSTVRTAAQTTTAKFWSANVIRQYNQAGRDIAAARGLSLPGTARLAAMVNLVGADALMSTWHAKYHYLFWRPVTAIDPAAVTADGYGPVPGYHDGNPATTGQAGWRPLLTTPNHPEYPGAHGAITSAMAEVFATVLGTGQIGLDIHGFDPAGPPGNLNAVRHFTTPSDLRREIINARLWAGLHYRFSSVAGVTLGRQVAKYDLYHAFQPIG